MDFRACPGALRNSRAIQGAERVLLARAASLAGRAAGEHNWAVVRGATVVVLVAAESFPAVNFTDPRNQCQQERTITPHAFCVTLCI